MFSRFAAKSGFRRRGQIPAPSVSPAVLKETNRITAELLQHASLVAAMLPQGRNGLIGKPTMQTANKYTFSATTSVWTLCVVLALILTPSLVAAQQAREVRELWVGIFEQLAPLSWQGRMELYIRYKSGDAYPQSVRGLITWPELGAARVEISGEKQQDSITFREGNCIAGDCGRIVLGGRYRGNFDATYSILTGNAELSRFSLQGRFRLKRVIAPE